MRPLLLLLVSALIAGCSQQASEPTPSPILTITPVANRCAGVPDLQVIDKRPSNASIGSRVYWCRYNELQGGVVFDDSACWAQAQIGQRRPIACENAR